MFLLYLCIIWSSGIYRYHRKSDNYLELLTWFKSTTTGFHGLQSLIKLVPISLYLNFGVQVKTLSLLISAISIFILLCSVINCFVVFIEHKKLVSFIFRLYSEFFWTSIWYMFWVRCYRYSVQYVFVISELNLLQFFKLRANHWKKSEK